MTQKEIAEALNISTATVSRALKDSPLINKETRERIKKLAKTVGYRPNFSAFSLLKGRTYTIGMIFPSREYFFTEMINSICQRLGEKNYMGFVFPLKSMGNYEDAVETMLNRRVDGIISAEFTYEGILKFKNEGVMSVYYGAPDIPCCCVNVDKYKGGFIAAKHLIEGGRKRIAYICGKRDKRFQGYKDCLLQNGYKIDESLILTDIPAFIEKGYQTMKQLISSGKKKTPDAVLAHNDATAFGAVRAISEAGLAIPDDIAVVGFDNISYSAFLNPPLTTIDQKIDVVSEKLVDALLSNIENKEHESCSKTVIDPELIVRASSSYQK